MNIEEFLEIAPYNFDISTIESNVHTDRSQLTLQIYKSNKLGWNKMFGFGKTDNNNKIHSDKLKLWFSGETMNSFNTTFEKI